ncbi:DUF4129 domain-containing protein [Paenibacillus sp. TRM 82003]|nr:DUF4129 domain-containing protein [Paenibacillus sp. TRM 82003]
MNRKTYAAVLIWLEGTALFLWCLLTAGASIDAAGEAGALLLMPSVLLGSGLALRLGRAAGLVALAASLLGVGSVCGFRPELLWLAGIGLLALYRFDSLRHREAAPSEIVRGWFRVDSFALPLICLYAFRVGTDEAGVGAAQILIPALVYFAVRWGSLRTAEAASGATERRLLARDALPAVGILVAALLLMAAFPLVAYVFSYIGVPLVFLLTPLVEWLQGRAASRLGPDAGSLVEPGDPAPPPLSTPVDGDVSGWLLLPGYVWPLAALAVIALLWLRRARRSCSEAMGPLVTDDVVIERTDWTPTRTALRYAADDTPIRRTYRQLLQWFESRGEPIRPEETPRGYADRVVRAVALSEEEAKEISALTGLYEQARYGDDSSRRAAHAQADRARRALEKLRGASSEP